MNSRRKEHNMIITIKGSPKEIADLVAEIQSRQLDDHRPDKLLKDMSGIVVGELKDIRAYSVNH